MSEGKPSPPNPVKVATPPVQKTVEKEAVVVGGEPEAPKVTRKVVGVQNYKRKSSSSISISGLKNQKKEEKEEEEIEDLTNKPRTPFTVDQLAAKWKSYGYKLKQSGRQGLHVTLSKRAPVLSDDFVIDFEIDNEVQKMEMESERSDLLSFLRSELNNYGISLNITLTAKDDSIRTLTSKDKFLKMAEKNSVLHELRERLNLDIEY